MFHNINDQSFEENYSNEVQQELFDNDATLTLVVPSERLDSFQHKIDRIRRQVKFESENRDLFDLLTKREIEIVSLLATGLDNSCIAESLFISRRTVEQHRKNIRRKLNVQSFVNLMEYALAFNLV